MQIALFIFYYVLACVSVSAIPFFKNSGIGKGNLVALFSIKILAGIAYAKFYTLPKYFATSDTWKFYRLSLDETKWLLHDPYSFLKDLFYYNYGNSGNLFKGQDTYWNDLKSNVQVKITAVFNVFSNSNYYVDIIFFNFLFLFGLVALFKILYRIYPQKKYFIIAGIFLLPSTLFWCSGIHKDGLILSAIGISMYCFQEVLANRFSIKYVLLILLSFLLLFALRNYVSFLLAASMFCWVIAEKLSFKKTYIFTGFYFVMVVVFFITPFIVPYVNPAGYFVTKQQEFLALSGGSKIYTDALKPTFVSFISYLPKAIDMAFLRPHINEFKNFAYLPAIVENLLLIVLIIISLFSLKKQQKVASTMYAMVAFSISVLLVCGYTVPFTGAIVRYKSIAFPLLITPLLCITNAFTLKRYRQNN